MKYSGIAEWLWFGITSKLAYSFTAAYGLGKHNAKEDVV